MTIPERPYCRSWLVVTSLIVLIATMVVILATGAAEGACGVRHNANAAFNVASFRTDNCLTVNGKGLNCVGLGTVHPAQIEELYLLAFCQSSC